MISAVDLLPTFCELADAKLPDDYYPDGISQVATLLGKSQPMRPNPLFWKMQSPWPAQQTKPHHWVSYAVVHEQWKLLANRDASYCELYDLTNDPFEKSDLKESKPKIVSQLKQKLSQWKATLPEGPTGAVFSAEREQLPTDN